MRIRDIEVINLHFDWQALPLRGGVCTGRLTSLVKVFTDEGLTGPGSVYSHPDVTRTIIEGHLRPALFGGGSA